jgi:phosphohistidine phosphatase
VPTLIVLRHAKAVHVAGLADRERPLTARGRRDARRAGEVLGELGFAPDLVLCSPSVRTRQTAELALPEFAPEAPLEFESDIYEAYPDELAELLRRTDPDAGTLLLVGHNPGLQELVLGLTAGDGDAHFRPGAFAVVELAVPWAELGPGDGRLVHRWSPKD